MRSLILTLPLLAAFGCASVTGEGGLPVHAPPFSSDSKVVRPPTPTGQLEVEAFPPSPTSKAHRPNGPWRVFNSEGRPISLTFRENASLDLPVGWYVIIGRSPAGALYLAQVEIAKGMVTRLSIPTQGVPLDSSYTPDHLEE